MKAYLVLQFAPDDISSNLYVDLLDKEGSILVTKRMPVFSGTAIGNIDIDTSIRQGVYFLAAHTNSNIQAESPSIKSLYLFNPSSASLNFPGENNCSFFINNEHLVAGLKNTVYYKATGAYNAPVNITGTIKDESNKTILMFKSEYKGLGKLQWVPVAGQTYTAEIQFGDGSAQNYLLPATAGGGVVLELANNENQVSFHALKQGDYYDDQKMTILGIMGNRLAFKQNFTFTSNEFKGIIKVDDLPEGILYLLVLYNDTVLARARTFISKYHGAGPSIKLSKEKSAANRTDIDLSMIFPENISGSFSISVTDYDREIIPVHNSMLTELLVNQETITRTILLSRDDFSRHDVQELAINAYSWKETDLSKLEAEQNWSSLDSNFITIKGRLVDSKTNKPLSEGNLLVFLSGQQAGSKILNPQISGDGRLIIKDLVFYDTAVFNYEWKGSKNAKLIIEESPVINRLISLPPLAADVSVFNNPEFKKKSEDIYKVFADSFASAKMLSGVSVKNTSYSRSALKEKLNRKYATGLFYSSGMARILDLVNDPPPSNGMNIMDFLQGKFGDLIVTRLRSGQYSLISTRVSSLSGASPAIKLFIDQSEASTDDVLGIMLSEVAMIKYYPPGNAKLPGVGAAGVVAIYTKKQDDRNTLASGFFSNSFKFYGYSPVKEFVEEVEPGKSVTTFYWDPRIIIQSPDSIYSARFKKPASARRLHVVIEGFTFEGDILYLDTIIEND